MMDNVHYDDLASYIDTLLGNRSVGMTAVVNESEDDYEQLIDDAFMPIVRNDYSSLSANTYLKFSVNGLGYIIPTEYVSTVKRTFNSVAVTDSIYDADHVLGKVDSMNGNKKYQIYLCCDPDYSLLIDSIVSICDINHSEIYYRKLTDKRPWLLGVTHDRKFILLDCQVLGAHLRKYNEKTVMA